MQCATMEKESGDIEYAYTYRAHIIEVCEFSYFFSVCKAFQTTARCASLFLRMFFDWVERKLVFTARAIASSFGFIISQFDGMIAMMCARFRIFSLSCIL